MILGDERVNERNEHCQPLVLTEASNLVVVILTLRQVSYFRSLLVPGLLPLELAVQGAERPAPTAEPRGPSQNPGRAMAGPLFGFDWPPSTSWYALSTACAATA